MTGTGGGKRLPIAAVVVAILLIATASIGCGGDDSTTATGTADRATEAADQGAPPNPEFVSPGGDNSVQSFGAEAPPSQRAAASAVLAAYLRAGVRERRVAQCNQLSAVALESLERLGDDCAAALGAVVPAGVSAASAMVGPVGSLRIKGERAYALYHGRGGVDYAIPMREEAGEWKVDALVPVALP